MPSQIALFVDECNWENLEAYVSGSPGTFTYTPEAFRRSVTNESTEQTLLDAAYYLAGPTRVIRRRTAMRYIDEPTDPVVDEEEPGCPALLHIPIVKAITATTKPIDFNSLPTALDECVFDAPCQFTADHTMPHLAKHEGQVYRWPMEEPTYIDKRDLTIKGKTIQETADELMEMLKEVS